MCIKEFITTPWGVFCIGVISSIVGALLYKLMNWLLGIISNKLKLRCFRKQLVDFGLQFGEGYTTAYAQTHTPFHQMLQVESFVIRLIVAYAKIAAIILIGITLLIIFQNYIEICIVVVSISCALATIYYQKVKQVVKTFDLMFDYIYGEKYKEKMLEGVKQHWDKMTGRTEVDTKPNKEFASEDDNNE